MEIKGTYMKKEKKTLGPLFKNYFEFQDNLFEKSLEKIFQYLPLEGLVLFL